MVVSDVDVYPSQINRTDLFSWNDQNFMLVGDIS